MATKLYEMKGKSLPESEENDWTQTVLIVGGVSLLVSMIGCYVI